MKRPNPKVHYEPRRKKLSGPSTAGMMKSVRIDARTEILVSSDIPDDIARQRFIDRLDRRNYAPAQLMELKKEIIEEEKLNGEEIPVGSLEEMETTIAGMEESE